LRYVTEETAMPRGRKPQGDRALTNAERQARHRARQTAPQRQATIELAGIAKPQVRPAKRSRPQRWQRAVGELLALQADYRDWLAGLPEGLQDSRTAETLHAIVELDLEDLVTIELPRGYGRD
jgi:hypothetical protein